MEINDPRFASIYTIITTNWSPIKGVNKEFEFEIRGELSNPLKKVILKS